MDLALKKKVISRFVEKKNSRIRAVSDALEVLPTNTFDNVVKLSK